MARRESLTGDLFAHFGVDLREGDSPQNPRLRAIRRAKPCPTCRWLRTEASVGPCPVCGQVGPAPEA